MLKPNIFFERKGKSEIVLIHHHIAAADFRFAFDLVTGQSFCVLFMPVNSADSIALKVAVFEFERIRKELNSEIN